MQPVDQPPTPPPPLLDQALAHLEATKKRWPALAIQCGVPYSTITKIYQRVIRDPRVSTVQRLLDHRDSFGCLEPGIYPITDRTERTIPEYGRSCGPYLDTPIRGGVTEVPQCGAALGQAANDANAGAQRGDVA